MLESSGFQKYSSVMFVMFVTFVTFVTLVTFVTFVTIVTLGIHHHSCDMNSTLGSVVPLAMFTLMS